MAVNAPGEPLRTAPGAILPYLADDQKVWDELRLRPAKGIPINSITTGTKLIEGLCILLGWQVVCGGTATTVDVYDGRDTTGPLIASLSLPANGNLNAAIGGEGMLLERGLYLNVTAGTLKGAAVVRI